MRFISYLVEGRPAFGAVQEDGVGIVNLSEALGRMQLREALESIGMEKLKELALRGRPERALQDIEAYQPVVPDPRRIFCVGLNYEEHRREVNRDRTASPTIFLRLPHSQVGHGQPIVCPAESDCLDYEGEISIVIGHAGRRIRPEHAWKHIFGLAPYNDASVRDWQAHTTQWTPGKNFPSTGAFGPMLVSTDIVGESETLELTTELNGMVVQSADTDMLIFPIPELVAYISTFSPLSPGDVIVTGTPGGVGMKRNPALYMKAGDKVTVTVSRLGQLVNTVVKEGG